MWTSQVEPGLGEEPRAGCYELFDRRNSIVWDQSNEYFGCLKCLCECLRGKQQVSYRCVGTEGRRLYGNRVDVDLQDRLTIFLEHML